jgi:hypothetical protein
MSNLSSGRLSILDFGKYSIMLIYLMSVCKLDTMSESKKKELDEAQNDQDEVGEASSDPETSGPAENLREKAAKTSDKGQDSKEPA